MMFDKDAGFYNFAHYVDESYIDLTSRTGNYNIKYTIPFLEDALGGVVDSELVVVGADSGIGKTQFANDMAFFNALRGKNVYLFSLEGDKYDTVNRCRYKHYIDALKQDNHMGLYVPYRDFIINQISDQGMKYMEQVEKDMKRKYASLKVYSREEPLSMDRFEGHLDLIQNDADLIIIDHLHYFEFIGREYEAINEIMKKLKKKQEQYRIPIILVSHLRKKDKTRVFPDQDDFHGSSNIVKMADVVIVLAHTNLREDAEKQIESDTYQTGMRICKCRTGFSSKVLGVHSYNMDEREYSDRYELAICSPHMVAEMTATPKWAKRREQTENNDAEGNAFTSI